MTQFSLPWPDTSPQTGDGRKITSSEFAALLLATFGPGVLPYLNELVVTATGANAISVDTGYAIVQGRLYINDAALSLTPASAGAGSSRQDSVVIQVDWTGGGDTEQYTVRAIAKEGTSGAVPSLTQTVNVLWEQRLYNYTIDDAGDITGITNARTLSHHLTHVDEEMLDDGAVTEDKLGALAVTAGKLGALAVTAAKLAADAVETAKIKDLAVTGDKIAALTISAGKIAGLQITNGKIADGAVDANKLDDDIDATGIGFDAAKVGGYSASELLAGGLPIGSIVMWYGSLGGAGSIYPMVGGVADTKWQLCDGTNSTPDLRGVFPLGVGGAFGAAKGATGGRSEWNWSHAHANNTLQADNNALFNVAAAAGSDFVASAAVHVHDISGSTANNGSASESMMPPYRAVYWMMKVA